MTPRPRSEPPAPNPWRRLLRADASDEAVRQAEANLTGFFDLLIKWHEAALRREETGTAGEPS